MFTELWGLFVKSVSGEAGARASDLSEMELQARTAATISQMTQNGIKLLALDFDNTIVDVHTYGMWRESAEELAKHVRPVFQHLIFAALEVDMNVAVVTFSGQCSLIRNVLELSVGAMVPRIMIRGSDESWAIPDGCQEGKQPHLTSVCQEILQQSGVEVSFPQIVLVDDDNNNIKIGIENSVNAVWLDVNPQSDCQLQLLEDLTKLNDTLAAAVEEYET